VFQRGAAKGLRHLSLHLTGQEEREATVVIRNQTVRVTDGLEGKPELKVIADSQTWLRFVRKEDNLVWALVRRKIRIHGSPRLLLAFRRCFPSQ
jgi:putative sterol carrier protein